jgi:hypothetical protein
MLASHLYILFLLLAIVFAVLGWLKYHRSDEPLTTAARVRFKMAIIFTLVAAALYSIHRL